MCKAIEDMKKRAWAEGFAEGFREQILKVQRNAIKRLMRVVNMDIEDAMKLINVPEEDHDELMKML